MFKDNKFQLAKDLRDLKVRTRRIETRLAQLMVYLGANIHSQNKEGGFFDHFDEEPDDRRSVDDQRPINNGMGPAS